VCLKVITHEYKIKFMYICVHAYLCSCMDYFLKRGLTQMACVGKMSPDMQVSRGPAIITVVRFELNNGKSPNGCSTKSLVCIILNNCYIRVQAWEEQY